MSQREFEQLLVLEDIGGTKDILITTNTGGVVDLAITNADGDITVFSVTTDEALQLQSALLAAANAAIATGGAA